MIVTATTAERAKMIKSRLNGNALCCAANIIGEKASNIQDVETLLNEYNPFFISIAAKDKEEGDNIHADYAELAVQHGKTLCEKPFMNANGDGSSLMKLGKILRGNYGQNFGLNLPLAVLREEMMKDQILAEAFGNAEKIHFYWSSRGSGRGDIMDDLALHPWSLLVPGYEIEKMHVEDKGEEAYIWMKLRYEDRTVDVSMELKTGGDFRGMQIDGQWYGIKNEGLLMKVIPFDHDALGVISDGNSSINGDAVAEICNPLKENILASLNGTPIAGIKRAIESQEFLEALHGYRD